jgi:hypothetical protein
MDELVFAVGSKHRVLTQIGAAKTSTILVVIRLRDTKKGGLYLKVQPPDSSIAAFEFPLAVFKQRTCPFVSPPVVTTLRPRSRPFKTANPTRITATFQEGSQSRATNDYLVTRASFESHDRMDATRGQHEYYRENGRYGSHPIHDNYDDESNAD